MAVALKKGRIVAVGVNSYVKTHPQQRMFAVLAGQPKREYLHAEIATLIRSPRDCDTLLVVRINKAGDFVCAQPCPVCSLAIHHFNPKLVVIHT